MLIRKCFGHRRSNVGASLLAIAVCQATSMSDVNQSSRASSLPQESVSIIEVGSTGRQSLPHPAHVATRHTPDQRNRGDWR
ncbi:hypothetical protein E3W21_26265 [Pseudomonas sp. F01002]|nr:hypothetical protein E3W21_26265 [Pseudomonas sp. F01002]